ncbi:MAG: PepSY domain-containing protein [Syntrophomonas sp.]|nr:PepSY domain-containing protein [Syntrophomonas sp.]
MVFKEVLKKFSIPLLAGAVVFGSVAGGTHVFAATTQTQSAVTQESNVQTPDYTASITVGQQDNGVDENKVDGDEAKEDAALASMAKISKDEAANSAKSAYPEYTVNSNDLGDENGNLVYEVKMADKTGAVLEVKVDAGNAKVLAADKDNETKETNIGNEKSDSQVDNDNIEENIEE